MVMLCAVLLLGVLLFFRDRDQSAEHVVRGTTMGTVYTVRAVDVPVSRLVGLEEEIRARLAEINATMSVYRQDSEISRYNALFAGEFMTVSEDFENVIHISLKIHALTDGAFDPTIKPLLDLWGFGPDSEPREEWRPPDKEAVNQALEAVGMEHIDASIPGQLGKLHSGVQLDLGGVAKGFAVDAVADLLDRRGVRDYLMDIGGDLRVSGRNPQGEAWRIGVNHPQRGHSWEDVLLVLRPTDTAVLTSGDYRQYLEHKGRYYSHVLDPRTGAPLENDTASVTVIAQSATIADALATGLMVMGPEQGLQRVEALSGVEALFLIRTTEDGLLRDVRSSGFDRAAGLE